MSGTANASPQRLSPTVIGPTMWRLHVWRFRTALIRRDGSFICSSSIMVVAATQQGATAAVSLAVQRENEGRSSECDMTTALASQIPEREHDIEVAAW